MAEKKVKKPPFKTENMTVDEIIGLGNDVLNKFDTRDLSRALRTVSLAANKRLNRLMKHAVKEVNEMGDVTFTEKGHKGIDFEALYANLDDSGNIKKFGVGKGKVDRDTIYKEFARVRRFMNAGSTTISGAIALRKSREKALFGKTSEEILKGVAPAERELALSEMKDVMKEVYSEFHKWKEEYDMQGGYTTEKGKRVLKMLTRRMYDKGMSGEEARQSVSDYYDKKYEKTEMETQVEDSFNAITGQPDDTEFNW